MLKTFTKILLVFLILVPIFFFVSIKAKPAEAQTDSCQLIIGYAPYDLGEHIYVTIQTATPNTSYLVNISNVGGGIVYSESGNTGGANFYVFPEFVPGSGGDYVFAASNQNMGLPCQGSGTKITVGSQTSD